MVRKTIFLLLTLVILFSILGCAPAESPQGQLRVASLGSPNTLNPLFIRDNYSFEVVSLLHANLFTFNHETLEAEPALVKEWSVEEEGKVYILQLNDNVKWSDGTPLTAEDVAFTLRVICHPDFTGYHYALYFNVIAGSQDYHLGHDSSLAEGSIQGIEVIDENTLKITLDQEMASFLTYLDLFPLPAHILGDVPVAEMESHEYSRSPEVTAGPYILNDWAPDEYLHFEGNPEYYLGQPRINEIFYRIIPNQEAQLIDLKGGDLDLIPTAVKLEDVEELKEDSNIKIYSNPRLVYDYLGFNMDNPESPLYNREVRQALSMVLDREAVVRDLLLGYGRVAQGPLAPLHFPFDENFVSFPVDTQKAQQLLDESGYGDGFELKLIVNAGNEVRENTAVMFKEAAGTIGVEVKIQALEWQTYMESAMQGDFDVIISGQGTGIDPDLIPVWHSQSPLNELGYVNHEVDSVIQEAIMSLDREERSRMYRRAQEMIVEDAPMVWLYYREALHAASDRLSNFTPHPNSTFYNVHQWEIK
ncbi:MAG: ABC transporter substrate-binding protein [Candidatus Contubernalis sp.]|nr:ABC transporter substrate-binding protein [Candidatus Contubernalis sp.]